MTTVCRTKLMMLAPWFGCFDIKLKGFGRVGFGCALLLCNIVWLVFVKIVPGAQTAV